MSNSVTLKKGYEDHEGNLHREVKLRAPKMRDEVIAAQRCMEDGYSPDGPYFEIAFTLECIVEWEGIADPQPHHLLELGRSDMRLLRQKLDYIEKEASGVEAQGNSDDGE